MPLEVRQIGIRLNVGAQEAPIQLQDDEFGWGPDDQGVGASERAAIVNECVEAVLAELKLQGER
jgi:hypothetical protein